MRYRSLIRNTRPFIIKIDTRKVNPLNTSFTMPFPSGGTGSDFRCRINWGDGTFSTILAGDVPQLTHVYSTPGEYEISVKGRFDQIKFNNSGDRLLLTEVKQWGDNNWKFFQSAFYGCANMIMTATDKPNMTEVIDMGNMFRACTSFNSSLAGWNTSNVQTMTACFLGSTLFNQDLSSWDVSKVVSFSNMFQGATAFNNGGVPLTWNLKTTGIIQMISMFNSATNFNVDISSWNTQAVTRMDSMFNFATNFNQNISSWNVSNVTHMPQMFRASKLNQDLGNWNIQNVIDMTNMYQSVNGLSAANWSFTLSGWVGWTGGSGGSATKTVQSNINMAAVNANFLFGTDGEWARNYLITTKGWTINDLGGL